MISHAPSASPSDIIGCLLSSADNIESANPNYQGQLGSGRINAEEALICLNAFTYSLDAGITNIFSPEGQLCTATVNPQFELRNYGSQTLTSATISYQYDGGTIQTINWSGSLAQAGVETVSLPTETLGTGPHVLEVYCNSPNGNTDQNNSNNAQSSNFNIIPTGQIATVEVTTDCWGSEVLWNITEPGGTEILASGGPYTDITGGETYQSDVCLAAGCYVFTITDGYGDGMHGSQYGSCDVDGSYNISESNGNVIAEIQAANSDYGTEEVNNFCISSNQDYDIGVSEILNPEGTICDASIEAQVVLFNYGSQSVSSVDIDYDYGGGAQSMTYNGSIPSGSSVTVTLPLYNGNGGASTFSITTSNPDGNADANALNDNMTSDYYLYDNYVGLPFIEDFESNSFATNDWYMSNPDNGITWEIVSVVGSNPGDKAAKMDFFNYENGDERDAFQTPALDFGSYNNIEMSFEHAFRRYNQQSRDSLAILISTDCGATFQYLASYAEDGTGSFATATTDEVPFVPAAGNWCTGTVGSDCFTIDLNAYSGISGVIIKFESVNNGINGNNLFIDNINITGDPTNNAPSASFTTQNSSICLGDVIQFDDNSTGGVNSWNWNFGDGATSTDANPSHQYTNSGTYTVSLTVGNNNGTNSTSATVVVNDLPNVSLTTPNNSVCSSAAPFNLQGSPAGGNYAGPGMSGASFNPFNAGPGTHTISYTYSDNNGCSASTQITITVENGPNVSLVSPESVACVTDNAFNLQGSPAGGSYFGPGMGGNVFTPSSAGIGTHVITYEYTDNNGCSASSEVVIVVEDCTVGIEENQLNSLVLYPNPNAGRFTFSKVLDGAEIEIYSVDGKCIYKAPLSNEEDWIDISNSESGVYTLKMKWHETERNFRVILR
jgi:PKD repeat protein